MNIPEVSTSAINIFGVRYVNFDGRYYINLDVQNKKYWTDPLFHPPPGFNPQTFQLIASGYTNYATWALNHLVMDL
jgi:hypothetical protein